MARSLSSLPRLAAATLALGVLAGCANIDTVAPGTPVDAVTQKYGAPTSSCPLPGGGQRLVWSQQPLGQYAWGTNTTADGRVGPIEPILTDEAFHRLDTGEWSAERVRCEFGPPAEVREVGMKSVRQVTWAYRYRESGVWNSLMYLYMGADGTLLNRRHPGPDPMYDDRSNNWD